MIFGMFLDLLCCFCAENYGTEAGSCFFISVSKWNRNGNKFKAIGQQEIPNDYATKIQNGVEAVV